MSLTYTWKVTTLKKMDTPSQADVVVQAYWSKTGTDEDGVSASFLGTTSFKLNSEQEFIPFEELTEEIVLNWIKAATVNEEDAIDAIIQQKIIDQKSNVVRMPWEAPPTPLVIPNPE